MKRMIGLLFLIIVSVNATDMETAKNVDMEIGLLQESLSAYKKTLEEEKMGITRVYEKEKNLALIRLGVQKLYSNSMLDIDEKNKNVLKKRIDELEFGVLNELRKVRAYEEKLILELVKFALITAFFTTLYNILTALKRRKIKIDQRVVDGFDDEVTAYELYRLQVRSWVILVYTMVVVATFLIENLTYLWTTVSVFSAVIILGIREQLGDLLVGLIFKSEGLTSLFLGPIHEGKRIEIQAEDEPGSGSIYRVTKFNLFKTIIFNEDTNEIESIKNADFIRLRISHLPVENLHNIKLKFVIPVGKNLQKIRNVIEELVNHELEKDEFKIKFQELKPIWPTTNNEFNVFPKIRNKTKFKIKVRNEIATDLIISITLYTLLSKGDSAFHFYKIIQDKLREMLVFEEFKEYNLVRQ